MFVAYFLVWRNNDWVVLIGRDFLLKLFAAFRCNRVRCAGWRARSQLRAPPRRAQIEELGQFGSCATLKPWFKRELTLTAKTRQDVKVMRQSFYVRDAARPICIPMTRFRRNQRLGQLSVGKLLGIPCWHWLERSIEALTLCKQTSYRWSERSETNCRWLGAPAARECRRRALHAAPWCCEQQTITLNAFVVTRVSLPSNLPRYVGFIVRTAVIRGGLRQNANRRRIRRPLQQKLQERTTRQFHVYRFCEQISRFHFTFCRRFDDFSKKSLDSIIKKGKLWKTFIISTQHLTTVWRKKSLRDPPKAASCNYSRHELSR